MARGDISLRDPDSNWTSSPIVASGVAQSINAGEPTIGADATAASWTGAVKIAASGDPTTASGHRFTGIAKSDSTDTVAAAGNVTVWLPIPGTLYQCKAKTASTANTQALVDGLRFKRVYFNLTSTAWRVDAAAADALANGVVIMGGDYQTSLLTFLIIPSVSIFGATN